MQTTETRTPPVVTRAALAAVATAVLLVGLAALVADAAAVWGAVVGSVIAIGIFAFGAFSVDAVARLMPMASLMFAMLTYTLQVVLMALAFVSLSLSGMLDEEISRNWLGGAIMLGAFVWLIVQIRLATTARIPAFEAVATRSVDVGAEGGAR